MRLLQQREEAEEARVLGGIQHGLEDMQAGRTQPLAEAFADIRRDLKLPQIELADRAERMDALRASVEDMREGNAAPTEDVLTEMQQTLRQEAPPVTYRVFVTAIARAFML